MRRTFLIGTIIDGFGVAQFPQFSIVVWGGISHGYKSRLIMFDGAVGASKYIDALKGHFLREAYRDHNWNAWVFVQDGATPHTAHASVENLQSTTSSVNFGLRIVPI
jgi:hypothetical protein